MLWPLKWLIEKAAYIGALPPWYKSYDDKKDQSVIVDKLPTYRESTNSSLFVPKRKKAGVLCIMLLCLFLFMDGATACSELSQLSGIVSNNQGTFTSQSSFLLQDGFEKCFNVKNAGLSDYTVSIKLVDTIYFVKTNFLYYTSNIIINEVTRGFCDTNSHLNDLKLELFGKINPDIPLSYVERKFDAPLQRLSTGCGWFTDGSAIAIAYPSVDYTKPHFAVYKNIVQSVMHTIVLKDNLNGVENYFNVTGYSQSFNVSNFIFSLDSPSSNAIGDVFYTINKLNNAFADVVDDYGIGDLPVTPVTYGLIGGEQHFFFNKNGVYISSMVIPNFPMYAQFQPVQPGVSADTLAYHFKATWDGISVWSSLRSTTFDTSLLFPDNSRYSKFTNKGCQLKFIKNEIQTNQNQFIHAPEYNLVGCPPTVSNLYFQSTFPISIVSSSAQIKSFKIISAVGRYQDLEGVTVNFKIDSIGPTFTVSCDNVQGTFIITPKNLTFSLQMYANLDTKTMSCCIVELNLCDSKNDLVLLAPNVPLYSKSLNFPNITTTDQSAASSSNWWIWLVVAVLVIVVILIVILVVKFVLQKKFSK